MDIKDVIETGSEAIADSVEKVTASLSAGTANLAESPIGKQIASIVTAAGEKAEEAIEKTHLREAASSVSVPAPADIVNGAKEAAPSSHTTRKAVIVGGAVVVAGAAAAAGVVAYRRHQGSQSDEDAAAEEGAGAVVTPIPTASAQADDAPQGDQAAEKESPMPDQTLAADPSFASAIDAEAEHFVKDFVDHIDEEEELGGLDLDYAIELDAEADHFAQELVDHIEVTDDDLREEEELEKQS